MPIYMADLIKEAQQDENIPKFLQLFHDLNLSSPMNRLLEDDSYLYDGYRYERIELFTNTIVKAILDNLFNKRCGLMPELEQRVNNIYRHGIPSKEATESLIRINSIEILMTYAARFNLIKVGNCVERSAYSAISLAEIFRGTNVRVALQAMSSVDHVAVTLGPIKSVFYVYDPLINPEIAIPLKEYQTNIQPKFPKTNKVLSKIKITIDSHILCMYDVNKDRIMERIVEQLTAATTENLWNDREFREILVTNGYNKEYLNQARQILDLAIEKLQIASNTKTDVVSP